MSSDAASSEKSARHELQRHREELETILDSVPAYIWFKDADNRILRANRLAAESINLTPNEIEGRSAYELFPAEAEQYHRDDLEVIRTGRPKLGIIEPLQLGDRKRWISADKVPYRNASGSIIGVIVFAVDITERVHAEEALRRTQEELERRVDERTAELAKVAESLRAEIAERSRAEKDLRRKDAELARLQRVATVESMAAELAHELNQPLAAIVNFARGLRRRLQDGTSDMPSSLHATEQIGIQASRAADVVRRLREFIGRNPPRRIRCDLGRVIRDAVALIETEARAQGVNVHVSLEPGVGTIKIDPVRIAQVILNLLRNALDAMREAPQRETPEILIDTARRGARVEIRVVDTGSGLVTDAEKLFEPYYTTKQEGLGMGLAISRSIVAAHGGELWAAANAERGATFTFTLPCA